MVKHHRENTVLVVVYISNHQYNIIITYSNGNKTGTEKGHRVQMDFLRTRASQGIGTVVTFLLKATHRNFFPHVGPSGQSGIFKPISEIGTNRIGPQGDQNALDAAVTR
jgi:hypothetical protein